MVIKHVGVVGSTNDLALQMAREGAGEGTVIIADMQTSGRGRRGRVWTAESGQSILMSLVLRPELPRERMGELSFVAAVAAARFLESNCRIDTQLKWPNDLYVADRKIGGILIETCDTAVVAGIGINVNQRAFPDDLGDIATSVMLETGQAANTAALAEALARQLMECYHLSLSNGFVAVLEEWRRKMWGMGAQVQVDTPDSSINGRILGVDNDGALMISDLGGVVHNIHAVDAIKTTTN